VAYQLTILPIIALPKEDELFSSWLYRLAIKNMTKVHTFYKFHLPGQNIWNRDIDRLVSDVTIQRLSLLTEIPFDQIFQLTLRSYDKVLFEKCSNNTKQKWVLPLGIYHRTWKSNGLQYCPSCLSNDQEPYFRKSWRLASSVACIKCHTLLHDQCPSCSSPIMFFRADVGFKNAIGPKQIVECSFCGFDLRKSPRHPPVIGTIGFQSKIQNTIQSARWCNQYPSVEYFEVLYQILKVLRSKSQRFKSFKALIADYENLRMGAFSQQRTFELIGTIEREQLLRIAGWLLECWPDRIIQLCKESRLTPSRLLCDNPHLPAWMIIIAKQHLHLPSASERSTERTRRRK
jgi:hypothetical protein